jgi:hypothetical protein
MTTRTRLLAAAFALATLAGCGAVADHLATPPAGLSELEALQQLDAAGTDAPALILAVKAGFTHVNEAWLASLPLVPTLRVEDAVASAVIAATGWSPAPPMAEAEEAVDVVVAGL